MGNYNDGTFVETLPTITDATPLQDPIAGSTRVTITRINLDIGNNGSDGLYWHNNTHNALSCKCILFISFLLWMKCVYAIHCQSSCLSQAKALHAILLL